MSTMKHVISLLFLLPATCLAAETQPASGENATAAASSPAQVTPPAGNTAAEGDKTCIAVGQLMAMNWYHATMCTDRHKKLRSQERVIKGIIASTYPAFHTALTTPPLSDAGKYLATGSPYLPDSDLSLTEKGCKLNFDVLMWTVKDPEWRQAVLQCWEKPRPVAQETPPAPQ